MTTQPTTPASHHAGSTVHTNPWGEPETVPGCEGCAYRLAQAEAVAAREAEHRARIRAHEAKQAEHRARFRARQAKLATYRKMQAEVDR